MKGKWNHKQEANPLLNRLQQIWGRKPYPEKVHEELTSISPYGFMSIIATPNLFLERNWWELPQEALGEIGSFGCSKVFEYYFPALLKGILLNPDRYEDFLIECNFVPPKKEPVRKEFEEQYSFLSEQEKEFVCDFLEYIKRYYSHKNDEYAQRRIKRIDFSLKSYWRKNV